MRLYFVGILVCTIMISGMALCALQGNAPSKDTEGSGEETVVFPGYVTEGTTGGQPSITTPGFTTEPSAASDDQEKKDKGGPKTMPSEGYTPAGIIGPSDRPTGVQPGITTPGFGGGINEEKYGGEKEPPKKMPSEGSTTGGVGLGGRPGPRPDDKGGEKGGGPGPKGFGVEYETPAEGSSGGQSETGIGGSGGPIEY